MQTHNGEQSNTTPEKPQRRYDIDWLRVVAILAIFFFHCSRFFDTEGWHAKNAEQSFVVDVLRAGLVWMWVMELFFLLSGVGSWYALKSRTAGQYLLERVKRLLIPLYTVGLLILLPPQFYFEIVTNGGYTGTFREMIPRYFGQFGWFRLSRSPFTLVPLPFGGHLWFLQYLFLISLLMLPLLLYLKSASGQRLIATLAGWCDRRGGIFLFVIPIALVLIGLKSVFKGRFTWADFFYYAVFFVIGYMIPADNRFTESIKRHGWACLPLWIAGFCAIGFFIAVLGFDPYSGNASFSLMFVLVHIVISITVWSAVVFMLSLGAKYLNFKNKVLAYANEAVLPFYIFHQTIILCVGWFVIRWNIGILPKYLITAVISFALIIILYEALVRHFNVVRFFFGMRLKKKLKIED
jgi:peptidoglycan/LPS O-acetylase OafA/YrhL